MLPKKHKKAADDARYVVLETVQSMYDVRIPIAIESGSRGWGFASAAAGERKIGGELDNAFNR